MEQALSPHARRPPPTARYPGDIMRVAVTPKGEVAGVEQLDYDSAPQQLHLGPYLRRGPHEQARGGGEEEEEEGWTQVYVDGGPGEKGLEPEPEEKGKGTRKLQLKDSDVERVVMETERAVERVEEVVEKVAAAVVGAVMGLVWWRGKN